VIEILLTVTAVVPVDVRVTDWVLDVLRFTAPNAMLVAFTLNVATLAFN
jgi:hypothetical protein